MLLGLQLEPILLPILSPRGTSQKNRATIELKTPHQHRPGKEPVAETGKVVILAIVVPATRKMTKKEPETPKMTSSDPSPRRVSTRKKKKEPSPKPSTKEEEEGSLEDVEELELVSSSEEPELEEEEAEPAFPPLEKSKLKTQTSERKKSTLVFKILGTNKRLTKGKTPKRGESS